MKVCIKFASSALGNKALWPAPCRRVAQRGCGRTDHRCRRTVPGSMASADPQPSAAFLCTDLQLVPSSVQSYDKGRLPPLLKTTESPRVRTSQPLAGSGLPRCGHHGDQGGNPGSLACRGPHGQEMQRDTLHRCTKRDAVQNCGLGDEHCPEREGA